MALLSAVLVAALALPIVNAQGSVSPLAGSLSSAAALASPANLANPAVYPSAFEISPVIYSPMTTSVVVVDIYPTISTSTVLSTSYLTVYHCPPSVTDCPLDATTVTSVVVASTSLCPTTYRSSYTAHIVTSKPMANSPAAPATSTPSNAYSSGSPPSSSNPQSPGTTPSNAPYPVPSSQVPLYTVSITHTPSPTIAYIPESSFSSSGGSASSAGSTVPASVPALTGPATASASRGPVVASYQSSSPSSSVAGPAGSGNSSPLSGSVSISPTPGAASYQPGTFPSSPAPDTSSSGLVTPSRSAYLPSGNPSVGASILPSLTPGSGNSVSPSNVVPGYTVAVEGPPGTYSTVVIPPGPTPSTVNPAQSNSAYTVAVQGPSGSYSTVVIPAYPTGSGASLGPLNSYTPPSGYTLSIPVPQSSTTITAIFPYNSSPGSGTSGRPSSSPGGSSPGSATTGLTPSPSVYQGFAEKLGVGFVTAVLGLLVAILMVQL